MSGMRQWRWENHYFRPNKSTVLPALAQPFVSFLLCWGKEKLLVVQTTMRNIYLLVNTLLNAIKNKPVCLLCRFTCKASQGAICTTATQLCVTCNYTPLKELLPDRHTVIQDIGFWNNYNIGEALVCGHPSSAFWNTTSWKSTWQASKQNLTVLLLITFTRIPTGISINCCFLVCMSWVLT